MRDDDTNDSVAILIADDQSQSLLDLEVMLDSLADTLVRAASGSEALAYLERHRCALAILRVEMSELDGFAVAGKLRALDLHAYLPLIFVTGRPPSRAHEHRAYALGAVDVLYEPLVAESLRAKAGVFVELARQRALVAAQAALLEAQNLALKQAKERAERGSQYKSKFLASMSHELRTPLSSLLGFAELLLQEIFGPLNPRQRQYVKNVLQSGRQLLLQADEMVDLSKIEAGRFELHREWAPLREVVEGVVAELRSNADEKRVTLDVDVPSSLPPVFMEASRMRQVVSNLIDNAIKFTPSGGRVVVRALTQPKTVELLVEDNGIGIRPEVMARMFRDYDQLDEIPDTRRSEGSGLGLMLTQRLVELHGGNIAVSSQVGQGCSFVVTLPLGQSERAAVPSELANKWYSWWKTTARPRG